MTAETITVERVRDFRELLDIAVDSMERLWLDLEMGEVTPEEAAAIVNDTIRNLNAAAR